jgi:hypothetical protein
MRGFILSVLTLLCSTAFSQSLTGNWYGKADAALDGSNNNYLTELIIKQKGDEIEGIFGYYYRNGYKSQFIRAHYNKNTRQFILKNIPLTYFRAADIDGVDCMMDFYGTVMMSKVNTTIKGIFETDARHRYTCPEIRVSYTLNTSELNQDSLIKNSIARKLWQPNQEDVVINNTPAATTPAQVTPESATIVKHDTTSAEREQVQNIVASFAKRETVLSKEIELQSDSVRISFYDNGDIDGDSISVFLNKIPILTRQALTAQALNIYLKLDSTRDVNEVTMFAQNLGKYPPNTALMVVSDGEHRYEIYLSSSLTQNASVRMRRKRR